MSNRIRNGMAKLTVLLFIAGVGIQASAAMKGTSRDVSDTSGNVKVCGAKGERC